MIRTLRLTEASDREQVEALLKKLRLDPAQAAMGGDQLDASVAVQQILTDVAIRGDAAVVEIGRKFDDPKFEINQIRVSAEEMRAATNRVGDELLTALRRSIAQVRDYQMRIGPGQLPSLRRLGVEIEMRTTPLASAGLYVPGGKAAYPSTLVMLAVPAQVAGVEKIVVCTPPSTHGRGDLFLAACDELRLTNVFRAGGAAAIAAMAVGTKTIPAVDKIVGPGNAYVQVAKRLLAGYVGIDGFLGPSEVLILADDTADPAFVAADMLAQAEHDPGSCFLLTTSQKLADEVKAQLAAQAPKLERNEVIGKALEEGSAIIVGSTIDEIIALSDRFAAEHVNIQTAHNDAVIAKVRNAGCIFVGPWSPVAAGDYLAGPSHCLPTNTTARFASGVSVYEFLKRTSIARYQRVGLQGDAPSIIALANAEGLTAHAASIEARFKPAS